MNEKTNRFSNSNINSPTRYPAINNFLNFSIYVWSRSKLVGKDLTISRQKGNNMRTVYIANDGTQFDNKYECETYEFNLTISDHNLKFYDAGGTLLDYPIIDSRIYNLSDKVIVPDEQSLDVLRKVSYANGWCEFDYIDSIGVWEYKDLTPENRITHYQFIKENRE